MLKFADHYTIIEMIRIVLLAYLRLLSLILAVKELVGQKDLRMTIRYNHLSPENLREAVNVLDAREKSYVSATFEKEMTLANALTS